MHWFSQSSKLRRARQGTGAHRDGNNVGGGVPDAQAGAGREPDPYHAEFRQAEEPEERGMGGRRGGSRRSAAPGSFLTKAALQWTRWSRRPCLGAQAVRAFGVSSLLLVIGCCTAFH